MIDKVRKYILTNKLIENGDTLIMGISGGADSICLLCVLGILKDEMKLKLLAVHINHGLRETAARDQKYTEDMCKRFGIECKSVAVNVNEYVNENHVSTEEAGRILRYNAFEKIGAGISKHFKIAVAHNMDDNAETMLLNIIRGTGIKGLSGISSKRENVIRPLLCVTRAEIEKYLDSMNISFCTDETNLTDDYSRNKIRHNVIPVFNEINKSSIERMNALSNQISLAENFLEIESNKIISKVLKIEGNDLLISLEDILTCHQYIRSRVLLEILGKAAGKKKDIGQNHIDILAGLINNQVGKSLSLPYGVWAYREYACIRLTKEKKEKNNEIFVTDIVVNGYTEFKNEGRLQTELVNARNIIVDDIPLALYEKWFDYDKLEIDINEGNSKLVLRTREDNDYICINDKGSKKKLKSYMVDEKIPSSYRDIIPVLAIGSKIVWIVGYRDSSAYRIDNNTKKVLKIKYE